MKLLTLKPNILALSVAAALSVGSMANAGNLTRDNGALVGDNQNSQTAGATGPVVLQDVQLIQKLQRFDRERIPERVVHARGTGAHGEFTATADLSDITQASVFTAGKKTPVFVRFSTVVHGNHSPETLRDPRGFATKFYTEQGNWDLVGNNFPTFFIRDAIKFPDMVHAFKPDPDKNYGTDKTLWDFFQHVPEATRTLTLLFSNEGTPATYRHMDGSSVHAYKLVAAKYSNLPLAGVTEQKKIAREQNFKQAGDLFRSYDEKMQNDLINSLGGSLKGAEDAAKHTMLSYFYKADAKYGEGLTNVAGGDLAKVKALAEKLAD